MRLVYLSPVPWNSVAQRPHFFAKAALRNGFSSVLWVEPTPSRLPKLNDFRTKIFSIEANSFNKPEKVQIFKPRCIPLEPLGKLYDWINRKNISEALKCIHQYISDVEETILVIGKPSRFALEIMSGVEFKKIIFDVMDDFPQFFQGISARSMEIVHRQVIQNADMCFFSSHNLQEKYGSLAKQSELVLNACDEDFLIQCQSLLHEKNFSAAGIRTFGYVGSIAEWFDWDCVIKLAKDNPKDKIVIVGPNYSPNTPRLPSNIELRNAIQHSEIPKLLMSFDFGLIPFKNNYLTDSVDPVKYYEYVAAGCTVISSNFGEMIKRIENGSALSFQDYVNKNTVPEEPVTWPLRFQAIWNYLN
ncbi:glycosyltransferase family protein [Vibrio fluvialis]|uniref:glycosyltransferase n=1 Tax=Vibrio fluvialis TaxID=676 RepID=UPI002ACA61E7|nr:glycosyltransferase [Vibrio fluvialis]MDZ5515582.1 glycosyltransferase [Vibrio fluvialis]